MVNETIRLKPVAPQNAMQALRDITLGDVRIPQGMVVMAVMRRDATSERHLKNARAFEPERWLGDGGPALQAGPVKRISMPFGAGPRICPGRCLALLEMKVAMATLLGNFDIRSVDTVDSLEPRELLQLAMAPVGLTMRLAQRASRAGPRADAARGECSGLTAIRGRRTMRRYLFWGYRLLR